MSKLRPSLIEYPDAKQGPNNTLRAVSVQGGRIVRNPMVEKLLLRPAEAAEAIGVGRSKAYELIASGELPSVRIGGSVRVPVEKLREWIDRKAAERMAAAR